MNRCRISQLGTVLIVVVALLMCGLYFAARKTPEAPPLLIVSPCSVSGSEVIRLGDIYGLKFNTSTSDFTIREWDGDAPTSRIGISVKAVRGKAVLDISFIVSDFLTHRPSDAYPLYSPRVDRRLVFDRGGKVIGEDIWGYFGREERWRQVRLFRGNVVAKYGLLGAKDAAAFDQIISSVCRLSERP